MALEKTLPILLIFFVGLLLKRLHILKREHAPLISQLILNVVVPATIINSLSTITLSRDLLFLPLSGFTVVVTLLLSAFVLSKALGLQGKTRGAFIMSFPSIEIGSIGYAIMMAVYGPTGLAQIALFDLGNGLFIFTGVTFLAHIFGQSSERFRLTDALKSIALSPVIWSYGIGIGLSVFHLHSDLLSNVLTIIAHPLLFLIMLLIAVEFEFNLSSIALPVLAMYFKLSLGLIIGLLVSLLFGFTGVTRVAVVLGASLPSALITVVYARENALDAPFLASQLSMALPVAIGFSSLLVFLCH